MKAIFLIMLFFLGGENTSKGQQRGEWGLDINGSTLLASEYGNYILDGSIQFHYVLNKNLTVALGGMYLFTDTNNYSWSENDCRYTYEDDNQMNINAVASIMLNVPIVKKTGVMCDVSGFCSIFPFESVKISRSSLSDIYGNREINDKLHFDYFAPGAFADLGLYHDFGNEESPCRIALSYGVGYYQPLKGARHSTVFGQNVGAHLPSQNIFHRLTLRFIIFK